MSIKKVQAKLGNMRKAVEWVLYPQKLEALHLVVIQSDKRIAEVNLTTGKAKLSTGKGGHNGFAHLSREMGAIEVVVPPEILNELRDKVAANPQIGSVTLIG